MVMSATDSAGGPIVPGMNYTTPINGTGTLEDWESRFNATTTAESWDPPLEIPFIGDLVSGFSQFYTQFKFLMDGIPALLDWASSMIPVSTTAFTVIAWSIRILTSIMFVTLIIEFISGRELLP